MPSFLGEYGGRSAENRDKKYIRAVESFLKQTHQDKELIIVSDGCTKTFEIYQEKWASNPLVDIIMVPKQPIYGGGVRNEGIKAAKGDIISYLDNDDVIMKDHLEKINKEFENNPDIDMIYYNDYLLMEKDFSKLYLRVVETRFASIGTSSISHRNLPILKNHELFSTGYGHDWIFCLKMASLGLRFKKMEENSGYIACHWAKMDG
jgi:glycosyltransferase involved in cell wall biosynthesis